MWPPFRCKRTRSSRPGGGFANTRWNIYPIIYTLKCKHKNTHKHKQTYIQLSIPWNKNTQKHTNISNYLYLEMQTHNHREVSLAIILFLKHLSDSLIFHPSWLPCWHVDCHWRKRCPYSLSKENPILCCISLLHKLIICHRHIVWLGVPDIVRSRWSWYMQVLTSMRGALAKSQVRKISHSQEEKTISFVNNRR